MNILITWARSYVAWSLIKLANRQKELKIFLWDTDKKSISFKSNFYDTKVIYPSPKDDFVNFKIYILDYIVQNKISVIYPTCEEIFYFSKIKKELNNLWCYLFSDYFEKLDLLHSKYKFNKYLKSKNFNIQILDTKIINKNKGLKEYFNINKKYIFKYDYSRFADNIYVNFKNKDFKNIFDKKIDFSKNDNNLLVQEFISWEHLCSFWVVKNWKLISNLVYKNNLVYNWWSWTFLSNIFHKKINNFVEDLVNDLEFIWFISFDFIENKEWLYLLECNPRITSWIHLFDDKKEFSDVIFRNVKYKTFFSNKKINKTFLLANILFNIKKIFIYTDAFKFKNEVLKEEKKLFFYQIYLLFYFIVKSIRTKKKLSETTTWDIEFNWK